MRMQYLIGSLWFGYALFCVSKVTPTHTYSTRDFDYEEERERDCFMGFDPWDWAD